MSEMTQRMAQQGRAVAPNQQAAGPETVTALISSPAMVAEFRKALPKHMPPEQFMRLALNEIRANPKLAQCTTQSLLGALMVAARLGLTVGGPLGQFYMTPRLMKDPAQEGKKSWQVVSVVGYQGLRDLVYRSGMIDSIQVELVRKGDTFRRGADESRGFWFEWEPEEDGDSDRPWVGVLTVARIHGAGTVWQYLSHKQVMARKARGAAGEYGPWKTDEEAMARKTGIRAIASSLPKSTEVATAVRADEQVQVWQQGQEEPTVQQIEGAPAGPVEPADEGFPQGPPATPAGQAAAKGARGRGRQVKPDSGEAYAPPPEGSPPMQEIPVEDPPEDAP